jgi:hypothetical protein
LSRYNGEAVETPQGKISKISTDTDEKAATIQFRANEFEEAMKKHRKFIRKQQAELVVLQQAAKEHHMNCQMVYTAVKMQAMWSESKVPQDQIKDFPELPDIFVVRSRALLPLPPNAPSTATTMTTTASDASLRRPNERLQHANHKV